ncbi:hypothetical protein ACFL6O_06405, partial [candidate division KSB1 bacterium]
FGGSNAGLFTVYAILKKPDVLNAGIAGSPMIGHCSNFMNRLLDDLNDFGRFSDRTLYMIYGENDYTRTTDFAPGFYNKIEDKNIPGFRCELEMIDNEGHVPYMSLYNGLKYVFERK